MSLSAVDFLEEAAAGSSVASDLRSLHAHLEEQCVAVAVGCPFHDGHHVSAGVALVPVFLAATAPEYHLATFVGAAEGFFVHPSHHEHVALVGILYDCRGKLDTVYFYFEFDFFYKFVELHSENLEKKDSVGHILLSLPPSGPIIQVGS